MGHVPPLPWVRSSIWVRVGLGLGLATGKGWAGTWPVTRLDPCNFLDYSSNRKMNFLINHWTLVIRQLAEPIQTLSWIQITQSHPRWSANGISLVLILIMQCITTICCESDPWLSPVTLIYHFPGLDSFGTKRRLDGELFGCHSLWYSQTAVSQ